MVLKVGFTCGAFDLLHAGHMLMLDEASEQCDFLIVGLQIDPSVDRPEKHKPIQTLKERKILLEGCTYVDQIWIYNTEKELYDLLKTHIIDIRILGADHKGKPFTGDDLNIPIYYNSRTHNYSSSQLRERIFKNEYKQRKIKTKDKSA